jgi:hypothetical protein
VNAGGPAGAGTSRFSTSLGRRRRRTSREFLGLEESVRDAPAQVLAPASSSSASIRARVASSTAYSASSIAPYA